jgi:serine phosphatase RsbU (regulator of sigma subunit)
MMPMSNHSNAIRMNCMELWGGNRAIDTGVSIPGIDAWIFSRPYAAAESGGDVHYVSSCAGGKIGRFILADVAGHGAHVADVALRLRDLMRHNINTLDQTHFALALNTLFGADASGGQFATAALLTYHCPSRQLLFCNAGHPSPLHWVARESVWRRLEDALNDSREGLPGNLPLGIIDPTTYAQKAVQLGEGDVVVAYSDALMEAERDSGGMLGEDGLLEILRSTNERSPEALCRFLVDAVDSAPGKRSTRDDDATIMVLSHHATNVPKRSLRELASIAAKFAGLTSVERGGDSFASVH